MDAILIDEEYLGLSHRFVTIVLHVHSGEPIYMSRGKDGKALDEFFASMTVEQKRAIRYVGIDRFNAYKAAALAHLPEALRRRLVGMR